MKLIAKGNTAEVFEYDNRFICKLFYPGYPRAFCEHEFYNAQTVFQAGIKTPRAHKMVRMDGRDGIVYDQVIGKPLSSLLHHAGKSKQVEWISRFVEFHKLLLKHKSGSVMDYKDFLRLFSGGSIETAAEINKLANGCTLLHGDFHPGNIIVDPDGELVLIDMMNLCRGPAAYDIARTFFLLEKSWGLQNEYLERMEYRPAEITPYRNVISLVRQKEERSDAGTVRDVP